MEATSRKRYSPRAKNYMDTIDIVTSPLSVGRAQLEVSCIGQLNPRIGNAKGGEHKSRFGNRYSLKPEEFTESFS